MNLRRLSLGAGLAVAGLSVIASACGGSGSPNIKRFEASETSIPLGGHDVTFSWDVSGESRLELLPFPGAVNGTSVTLNVTATTTFTLVAKGNGRTDRRSVEIVAGEPFTVAGRVLTARYASGKGIAVYVNGADPVLADATGNFRIEGVVAPYDVVLLDDTSPNQLTVYRGLTRPDPTLIALSSGNDRAAGVNGTLSGVPFPTPTPPPNHATGVWLYSADGVRNQVGVNFSTGTYSAALGWRSAASTQVSVTAMQWEQDTEGLPASFTGFARATQTVADGDSLTVDLNLAPVPSSTLSGSLTLAPEVVSNTVTAGVEFGAGVVPMSAPIGYSATDVVTLSGAPVAGTSASLAFTRLVPDIPDASFFVQATGYGYAGYYTRTRSGLAAGETGIDISIPEPPRILLPVNGAVVTTGTLFAVTAPEDMVNVFNFSLNGFGSYIVYLVTEEDQFTFPDLSAVGLGPDAVFSGFFSLQGYGPFDSVDDAAGPGGLRPQGTEHFVGGDFSGRSFQGPGDPAIPF